MLRSRADFVRKVFYPVSYRHRGLVVGFNLPYDISRLATGWGLARGKMYGGFSSAVVEYSPAEFAITGTPPVPIMTVTSADSVNFPIALAFDSYGDLWVANMGPSTATEVGAVTEFPAAQLTPSGNPAPAVTIGAGTLVVPFALAFSPLPSNLPIKP